MSAQPLIANPKDRFRKLALRLTGLPTTASDASVMFAMGVRAADGGLIDNAIWRVGFCAFLRVQVNATDEQLREAYMKRIEADASPLLGSDPLLSTHEAGWH